MGSASASNFELGVEPKGEGDYAARGINPERMAAIEEYAGNSVLDVGCGSGSYVLKLADRYDIRGVDYRYFDSWDAKPTLFSISDATTLDLPDNSVDTILSFETIEHLTDPEKALREYYRIVRKNIVLTVPNCDVSKGFVDSKLLYSHWSDPTHVNFFNMESIVGLVEKSGFRVSDRFYINQLNLGYAVMEAFGFRGFLNRAGARLFRTLQRKRYYITSLVVGEKR